MKTILYFYDTVTRSIAIFFILDIRYKIFIDLDEKIFIVTKVHWEDNNPQAFHS